MKDKKPVLFKDSRGEVWRFGYYTPTQTRMIILRYSQTGIMLRAINTETGKELTSQELGYKISTIKF